MNFRELKTLLLLLPIERREVINSLKKSENIVGLSGGKDSVATCIILKWLEIPYKTITAEVWWKEGITGENPLHYEFMHNTLFPNLMSCGVTCETVRSDITAYQFMTTPIVKSKYPERIGKLRGFPLCGKCGIQRDCKTKPCTRFYKAQKDGCNCIFGFASDEKDRILCDAARGKISILDLLDIEEYQTFGICNQEKLLSPTYSFSDRGGCWFCPNQKIQELEMLYMNFPNLWKELMEIQDMPNKIQEKFNRTQTLYDIEAQIKKGVQQKWFIGTLMQQK